MIRLEGLRVSAGAFSLQIDELVLQRGEYLVIVGPTGSGKTVLLETIAGMRQAAQGRVWFGDRDVTREPPERRRTGVVYQDYALFPHLTVADNIAFGLHSAPNSSGQAGGASGRRSARNADHAARVARLAGLLGVHGLLDRYPDGLSGGERQRVALARALAIEPEVLLLDEPLSALDRTTRRELRDELRRVHGELGATVLHVTHDLDEALALGERVAVLIDGRLRQVALPGEIVRRPADAAVARLLGMTNVFPVMSAVPDAEGVRLMLAGSGDGVSSSGFELMAALPAGQSSETPLVAVVPAEEIVLMGTSWYGDSGATWGAAAPPGPNILEGTVKEVQAQSVHASLLIEVPPLLSVHVLRPEVERRSLWVGSRVTLRIPPEVVHLCPA